MSKRLKLETLSTSRSLRSRKSEEKTDDLTSETSQFFVSDNQQEKDEHIKKSMRKSEKKSQPRTKKRLPVKIKCEDLEGSENEVSSKVKENWMPKNWEAVLENIKIMRKEEDAPVDEMGCHKCADTNVSKPVYRYQSLLALMLSSQTKDQVTHAAMQRLKDFGCTPDSIIAASDEELGKLIYPVSFWKRKVEYLKKTSVILKDKYDGDIPDTAEKLCELPGVGPKMAHICMQVAWDKISGIGVDTHLHRISNRLGWVKKTTKTPEDTRKELEAWLPRDLWADVNQLLVGFGQTICMPQRPKCTECLNKDMCPFAKKNGMSKK